jgi:hypothetical protein
VLGYYDKTEFPKFSLNSRVGCPLAGWFSSSIIIGSPSPFKTIFLSFTSDNALIGGSLASTFNSLQAKEEPSTSFLN